MSMALLDRALRGKNLGEVAEAPARDEELSSVTAVTSRRPALSSISSYPIPEPLRWIEPRETGTRKMYALG